MIGWKGRAVSISCESDDLPPSFEHEAAGRQRCRRRNCQAPDYCLSPAHPRGRHKARVFASILGLTEADPEYLRAALVHAAIFAEATAGDANEYGQRYTIDFELVRDDRRGVVRSAWIIRRGESVPDLQVVMYYWIRARMPDLEPLTVVALLENLPEKGLLRGQVGTVVESLAPGVYEVEFSHDSGRTYASLALRTDQLMRLRHEPGHQAA